MQEEEEEEEEEEGEHLGEGDEAPLLRPLQGQPLPLSHPEGGPAL